MGGQINWNHSKDPRKANLGRPFEEFVEYANNRYRVDNRAVIHKIPTAFKPIRNAFGDVTKVKTEGKPPMDFMGRYGSRPIAFETKHTKEKRIRLAEVDENQHEWLDDWDKEPTAITFVLVSFNLERFFAVPWKFWKFAEGTRDEGLKYAEGRIYGIDWTATGMASIATEEMSPKWEVKIGGVAGLDYLKTIDKIFCEEAWA